MARNLSNWQEFASKLDLPMKKDKLVAHAVEFGADEDEVRRALDATPAEEFNSPNDVTEALSKLSWPGA